MSDSKILMQHSTLFLNKSTVSNRSMMITLIPYHSLCSNVNLIMSGFLQLNSLHVIGIQLEEEFLCLALTIIPPNLFWKINYILMRWCQTWVPCICKEFSWTMAFICSTIPQYMPWKNVTKCLKQNTLLQQYQWKKTIWRVAKLQWGHKRIWKLHFSQMWYDLQKANM